MPKKVGVGKPFNDVEVIDAERRLRREKLTGTLCVAVVGFCLMSLAVAGIFGLVTKDWEPINAIHGYCVAFIAAVVGAIVGARPSMGDLLG